MFTFVQKRLELKIILALTFVIACMIGVYSYLDIRNIRLDLIHTSERTLGAFAAAIKGSVNASMKKGHHDDARQILNEVDTPYFIDRVMIYSEAGRPISGVEKMHDKAGLDMSLPQGIAQAVVNGDISDVRLQEDNHFLSYYSPIVNEPECFRCHGEKARLNGILRIDFSLRDLDDLVVARRTRTLLWSAALFILLTALLAALLRTVVYRPVKELRDAMASVQEGADAVELSTTGQDELADLKRNFLSMLQRINTLHRMNIEKEKELAHNQEVLRFRAELQAMFDAMPDGVLLVDPELRLVQSNPRVHEIVPALKTVDGRIPPELVKDPACPQYGLRVVFREAKIYESQCSFKLPEGFTRHVHCICAPIIEDGRVQFVVEVIRDVSERISTELELEAKTAELVALNRTLSQLAITDSLTQLSNRHRFGEILTKEIKRVVRRKHSSLALMMVDIDHFKKLNDNYGHLVGDSVLRATAAILREGMRETDTVARFGGEEFVIVLTDTNLEGAAHKAEVLRKDVQNASFPELPEEVRVTISIGVAAYVSGSPDDLVHAADLALYQAKNSGRNAVVVSRPEGLARYPES